MKVISVGIFVWSILKFWLHGQWFHKSMALPVLAFVGMMLVVATEEMGDGFDVLAAAHPLSSGGGSPSHRVMKIAGSGLLAYVLYEHLVLMG